MQIKFQMERTSILLQDDETGRDPIYYFIIMDLQSLAGGTWVRHVIENRDSAICMQHKLQNSFRRNTADNIFYGL